MAKTPITPNHAAFAEVGAKPDRVMARATETAAFQRVQQTLARFELDREELAELLDVPPPSFSRASIANSKRVQDKLRQMMHLIDRVRPWTRDDREALEWYRSQPIPAFGGITARDMVAQGLPDAVDRYLDGIAVGGFA